MAVILLSAPFWLAVKMEICCSIEIPPLKEPVGSFFEKKYGGMRIAS